MSRCVTYLWREDEEERMHPHDDKYRRWWAACLAVFAVLSGMLVDTGVATATPSAAPGVLAPVPGAVTGSNPVLSWSALPGASGYEVQASRTSDFDGSLLLSVSTANQHAVPTVDLPAGEVHWRVRGKDATGAGPWAQSVFVRTALDRPELVAPVGGVPLAYPENPTVFSWGAVGGAAQYRIEVDDSDDFVSPVLHSLTPSTSFTMSEPQTVGQTFFWRVRAVSAGGVNSQWSGVGSYSTSWDATPALVSPVDGAAVTDVVLRC